MNEGDTLPEAGEKRAASLAIPCGSLYNLIE